MQIRRFFPVLAVAIGFAVPAAAQHAPSIGHGAHTPMQTAALLDRLREGDVVLYVRHERTDAGHPDDPDFVLGDCTTQRNLSLAGIASAKETGESIRALGIPVGAVLASPMCRTLETARVMLGKAVPDDALYGYGLDGQTVADNLRGLIVSQAAAADGTVPVLVAHTANMQYAFGLSIHEGDAAVIAVEDDMPEIIGTIQANAWNDMLLDAGREHIVHGEHGHGSEAVQTD